MVYCGACRTPMTLGVSLTLRDAFTEGGTNYRFFCVSSDRCRIPELRLKLIKQTVPLLLEDAL